MGVFAGVLHFAPIALFMGHALIMVAANEAYRRRTGAEPPIGLPLVEAFPDPSWKPIQAEMFAVYETGCARTMCGTTGLLTIAPLIEEGRTVGVGTHFLPKHETPRWRLGLEDLARSPQPLSSRVGGRR